MQEQNRATARANHRPRRTLARDRAGTAAVEFALVLPALLMILVGIIQFGVALNNYLELTDAVQAGDRNLAISRSSVNAATPYSTTITVIDNAAANLTAGSITTTISINGTACTTDSGCQTAIAAAQGDSATITATYPCVSSTFEFYVKYFASGCTLTSTTSDLIE
jgi:Flp pilus assembly protein TadG